MMINDGLVILIAINNNHQKIYIEMVMHLHSFTYRVQTQQSLDFTGGRKREEGGETIYNCREDYFKQSECKNARLKLQGTRKLGCKAYISVSSTHFTLHIKLQMMKGLKMSHGNLDN